MNSFRTTVISVAGVLQGGYMVFDGVHKLMTGSYFGGRVGPWASVVSKLGVSLDAMAAVFVVVGSLWLVAILGMLVGFRWWRWSLAALAILSLWYVLFGMLLSIVVLVLLFNPARTTVAS